MNIVKCMKFEMDYIGKLIGTTHEETYIRLIHQTLDIYREKELFTKYLKGCTLHSRKVKEIRISKVYFKEKK